MIGESVEFSKWFHHVGLIKKYFLTCSDEVYFFNATRYQNNRIWVIEKPNEGIEVAMKNFWFGLHFPLQKFMDLFFFSLIQ